MLSGFAKTFCPSFVILSDEAGVLCQTFWVFVNHFTLKMASKCDYQLLITLLDILSDDPGAPFQTF